MTHTEPQSHKGESRGGAETQRNENVGALRRAGIQPGDHSLSQNYQKLCASAALRAAFLFAALCASLVCVSDAHAAGVPDVAIAGSVKAPESISFANLQKMPVTAVTIWQHTEKADVAGTFGGPLLWTLIGHAGWENGSQKNAMLRHTIIVAGKDGYAVSLSEGEIDPTLEGKKVILATMRDGKPMASPRLVVPGDAGAPRGVHDVVSITVQ